jgi:AraC-like DNA-binding protein
MTDPLADVLSALHLSGSVHLNSEMTAPWGIALPERPSAVMHVILEGKCWMIPEPGAPPVALAAGDLVLFPRGRAHVLADRPDRPTRQVSCVLHSGRFGEGDQIRAGGGGERTLFLCGEFEVEDPDDNPLFAQLPEHLVVRGAGGRASSWLQMTLGLLSLESTSCRPGQQAVLSRLIDMLLVQIIRSWIEQQGSTHTGWLGALRDRQVAAALGVIHESPRTPWTVGSLAAHVGMSRSAFAERFTKLVGEAPLLYLSRWRMRLAKNLLRRESPPPLGVIAAEVGYGSEAAFCKAFKRICGDTPGSLRRNGAADGAA